MRTVSSDSFRACYETALEVSDAERRLPALLRMLAPSSVRRRQLIRQPALPTIALTVLTVLLWSTPVLALDPSLDVSQYGHTAWTSRNGFLNGAVYAISQTADGYLWLGTQTGLFHFDGVRTAPMPRARWKRDRWCSGEAAEEPSLPSRSNTRCVKNRVSVTGPLVSDQVFFTPLL